MNLFIGILVFAAGGLLVAGVAWAQQFGGLALRREIENEMDRARRAEKKETV